MLAQILYESYRKRNRQDAKDTQKSKKEDSS